MAYVYIESERGLWTVGFYDATGDWHPDSDHDNSEDAAKRTSWLNGSSVIHHQGIDNVVILDGRMFWPGQRVMYVPGHARNDPSQWQQGRIKTIHPDRTGAWVTYHCDGQWDKYMDYTGALTDLKDLRPGWEGGAE